MSRKLIEWVIDDVKNTIVDRGKERDLEDGERTIPRCVVAFNSITGHDLSNEDGWLFMQILKMCRSLQGSYKYDDYRDGVGYAALRAEEAIMTEDERVKTSEEFKELKSMFETPDDVIRDLKIRGYGTESEEQIIPPDADGHK